MKKFISLLVATAILFSSPIVVYADYDFENEEDYYYKLCADAESAAANATACAAYREYLLDKQQNLQNEKDKIDQKLQEARENIEKYVSEIKIYESQIAELQVEINVLQVQIDVLVTQIEEKEAEIEAKEVEVELLRQKVKDRMVETQKTQGLNQYIDYFMGAESLTDLLSRITNINTLMEHDESVRIELNDLIIYLNQIKEELLADKEELDVKKNELETKKGQILLFKQAAEELKELWEKTEADLEAEGNTLAHDLQSVLDKAAEAYGAIDELPPNTYWTKPIKGSYYKSAGTWAYSKGGTHLGMDLAAKVGTPVLAAGNGLILYSVNGCPTYSSGLGDKCGGSQGGTTGGGNQVYLLTYISGVLYAVKYIHLQLDSPLATGTVVNAGDQIGAVGSSGNSSGPHVHIEVHKLGTTSISGYKWNGDLSFGCGFGSTGLYIKCSVKGAPCRERPEDMFGL